jgi:hypothetical protein
MNLSRKRYLIIYYDHRENPPQRRFQTYVDAGAYRRDLQKLRSVAGDFSQRTQTTIHLYPAGKAGWLDEEHT